jgi:hypothetical protein
MKEWEQIRFVRASASSRICAKYANGFVEHLGTLQYEYRRPNGDSTCVLQGQLHPSDSSDAKPKPVHTYQYLIGDVVYSKFGKTWTGQARRKQTPSLCVMDRDFFRDVEALRKTPTVSIEEFDDTQCFAVKSFVTKKMPPSPTNVKWFRLDFGYFISHDTNLILGDWQKGSHYQFESFNKYDYQTVSAECALPEFKLPEDVVGKVEQL